MLSWEAFTCITGVPIICVLELTFFSAFSHPITLGVIFCLHACMCVHHVHTGDQKKTSDPLELELEMSVNCHLGTVTWTLVSGKTAGDLNC